MIKQPSHDDTRNDWQAICWRMNERKITPWELARQTEYPQYLIEDGISGEPIPIEVDFLRKCVVVFRLLPLVSGKAKTFEKTINSLSYDDCMGFIKPTPAMPPQQGNFWEHND